MTAFDVARIGPGEGSVAPRTRLRSDAPSQSLDGAWRFRLSPSPALERQRPVPRLGRADPAADGGARPSAWT